MIVYLGFYCLLSLFLHDGERNVLPSASNYFESVNLLVAKGTKFLDLKKTNM